MSLKSFEKSKASLTLQTLSSLMKASTVWNTETLLLDTCTTCLTNTPLLALCDRITFKCIINLRWQGVTKFAYVTKYAFYPQRKQRYWFDKFTLCSLVHKSIFVSKGCQARQLCQVPEAVWWPVCGVQHELFPSSTCLLSFLVRQAIPKFNKKKHREGIFTPCKCQLY